MSHRQIELVRALILAAVLLSGLHWLLGDWMQSIETRLWFLDVTGQLP